MSVEMLLKIDRNQMGELKDSKHGGEIDVLAWSWGLSQSVRATLAAERERAGHARHEVARQVVVRPRLRLRLRPEHPEGLAVRPQGRREPRSEQQKVTMEDILVTSVSTGGSGGEDKIT